MPSRSDDLISRTDNYPNSHEGARPGRFKSYIDQDGNLVPANPNGKATVIDHVKGTEPRKSESPYTSFSMSQSTEKVYGNKTITLDMKRLQADIDSGRDKEVLIKGVVPSSYLTYK